MKKTVFRHVPLYRFLELCNRDIAPDCNKILDCGAGGNMPPLALFHGHGYHTTGIELDEKQLRRAQDYGKSLGMDLNIISGDMTRLDFDDESFDCVYSYNSIFHMKKVQIHLAVKEMKRVLKPNGLMFVNFLSVDDFRCGEGPHLGENQYEQMDDEPVIHSYFDHQEADGYFSDMTMITKERRVLERAYEGQWIKQGFIDYILRK